MIIVPGSSAGDIEGVTAGDGLSGGGTSGTVSVALDLNELTGATLADGDSLVFVDANAVSYTHLTLPTPPYV